MMDSLSKTKKFAWPPLVLASLLCVLMAGCGETIPTGTVQGNVLLDDAPYTDASVVFLSPETGDGGTADIQADGTFRIDTPLQVGSYTVYLAPKAAPEAGEPMDVTIDESVPEKYWSEMSDITIEVKKGANEGVKVQLKSE